MTRFDRAQRTRAACALKFDVAVAGAGVFGSWIAYSLAQRGHSVALADAHGPGNSRASSGGETRIIRMSYGADSIYTRMSLESLGRWKQLFGETGDDLFIESGALLTAPAANEHLEHSAAALARLNIRHERLKAAELKRRFPQFRFEPGTIGLYEFESGIVMARRAVQCVADAATRLGATYIQTAIHPRMVRKQIDAKQYVFACGSWMPNLFPKQLGERMFPTRQEILFFGVPGGDWRFCVPHMPAWVNFESGYYSAPDIEHRGFKVGIDIHGPRIDPEHDLRIPSPAIVKRARAAVAKAFPALAGAPVVESRVCTYPNTWNGDFLIDRLSEDTWIATGGSGHGFKHGPAVGRYFADVFENRIQPEPRFTLASMRTKKARNVF